MTYLFPLTVSALKAAVQRCHVIQMASILHHLTLSPIPPSSLLDHQQYCLSLNVRHSFCSSNHFLFILLSLPLAKHLPFPVSPFSIRSSPFTKPWLRALRQSPSASIPTVQSPIPPSSHLRPSCSPPSSVTQHRHCSLSLQSPTQPTQWCRPELPTHHDQQRFVHQGSVSTGNIWTDMPMPHHSTHGFSNSGTNFYPVSPDSLSSSDPIYNTCPLPSPSTTRLRWAFSSQRGLLSPFSPPNNGSNSQHLPPPRSVYNSFPSTVATA